jgi:hypothetical protein
MMPHLLSSAELQSLGHSMTTKLPRELRDIIYSYSWDKEVVDGLNLDQLIGPWRNVGGCLSPKCECKMPPCYTSAIANKDLVGEHVAIEALEWLYSNSYDATIGSLEQIITFLTADLFGIRVKAMDYRLPKLTTVIRTPGDTAHSPESHFCSQYASLAAHKLHPDFTLHVQVEPTNPLMLDIQELYCIATRIQHAVESGMDMVKIRLSHKQSRLGNWNVTALLNMPALAWIDEFATMVNEVSQTECHLRHR